MQKTVSYPVRTYIVLVEILMNKNFYWGSFISVIKSATEKIFELFLLRENQEGYTLTLIL